MQVGLYSEIRVIQTNGSRTWISFIWILSCYQSFIGIPKAYIQYNPANLNPLGEYELGSY